MSEDVNEDVSRDVGTDGWLEREVTVRGRLGLHARPAGAFAAISGRFQSEISVSRVSGNANASGNEWVNGKSILSLLTLVASQGTKLRIRAQGLDAREALDALGSLLEDAGEEPG